MNVLADTSNIDNKTIFFIYISPFRIKCKVNAFIKKISNICIFLYIIKTKRGNASKKRFLSFSFSYDAFCCWVFSV